MSLPPGTRLGPYEIVAPLGEGGMGVKRSVAIKVLPASITCVACSPEGPYRVQLKQKVTVKK